MKGRGFEGSNLSKHSLPRRLAEMESGGGGVVVRVREGRASGDGGILG